MSKITSCLIMGCVGLFVSACANLEAPAPVTTELKTNSSLATTTGLSQVLVRAQSADLIACTQPQPDATFDQSETGNVSLSLVSLGGNDQGGGSEASQEQEMAGRTPAVLMARELFFRLCEFSGNYQLSKEEALDLFNKTLVAVNQVWATEAAHTTITISDTLSASETTTAGAAAVAK